MQTTEPRKVQNNFSKFFLEPFMASWPQYFFVLQLILQKSLAVWPGSQAYQIHAHPKSRETDENMNWHWRAGPTALLNIDTDPTILLALNFKQKTTIREVQVLPCQPNIGLIFGGKFKTHIKELNWGKECYRNLLRPEMRPTCYYPNNEEKHSQRKPSK